MLYIKVYDVCIYVCVRGCVCVCVCVTVLSNFITYKTLTAQ